MARKSTKYKIPSPAVVRTVAVIILVIDLAVIAVLGISFQTLDWTGYLLMIGAAVSTFFPIKALQTGDPEWVLLDLIIPG